jgi:hypothetical protein
MPQIEYSRSQTLGYQTSYNNAIKHSDKSLSFSAVRDIIRWSHKLNFKYENSKEYRDKVSLSSGGFSRFVWVRDVANEGK